MANDKAIEAAARASLASMDIDNRLEPDPQHLEKMHPEARDNMMKHLRAAIAAYEAALWQPINGETPKDGTIILLADGREVAAAYWGFARKVDRMTADKTFPWVILDETNGTNAKRDPEAWRPLPSPPESST